MILYGIFAGLAAGTALAPWAWVRAVMFLLALVAAPLAYFETLSLPKLLSDEIRRSDEQVMIAAFAFEEGVAIYYLLLLPGADEPRFYAEPWDEKSREKVEAMMRGQDTGQQMMMQLPFERSLETRREVHPLPPPAEPPK